MKEKKTINRCQHVDDTMLEISDKDFTAAIIKTLQCAIVEMLETNEKVRSLSKEIKKN